MQANLTLASGSRAGAVVDLHAGYYLIGRDAECQIRPKSRSVSRRHCLLRHHQGRLHAFDLSSTGGTWINDQPLQPQCWYPIADGDRLRCGKIAFDVCVPEQSSADAAAARDSAASRDSDDNLDTLWQADEIADWMTDVDETEQAERRQRVWDPDAAGDAPLDAPDAPPVAKPSPLLAPPKRSSTTRSRSPRSGGAMFGGAFFSGGLFRGALPTFRFAALGVTGDASKGRMLLAGVILLAAFAWLIWSAASLGDQGVYQQIKVLE